jgi:hypothetical protein
VEDHEALKTSAIVSKLTDAVKDKVDDLLANGVVASGVVVGSIFLAGDDLLGLADVFICFFPFSTAVIVTLKVLCQQ